MIPTPMSLRIPKIILQTAKDPVPEYVVEKFKALAPDWEYRYFNDDDILRFFQEEIVSEFPTIIDVYGSIKKGQHRADLFRYAFLYKYGGVFIDSDAMIQVPLDDIAGDYEFFTVYSVVPNTVFQGFLGVAPRHFIIRQCLEDMLHIDLVDLDGYYFLICMNMYKFIHGCKYHLSPKCKMYTEFEDYSLQHVATTVDTTVEDMVPLLRHYYGNKVVPL
jgi:Glycosyltransferase sugar-binding region containing DXD motif